MYLYHYTNEIGAIGILGSKRLWATSFLTMEDQSELTFGLSSIISQAIAEVAQSLPSDLGNTENLKASLEQIGDEISLQLRNEFTKILGHNSIYLVCFTEHGNDDEARNGNLTHWRNYSGSDGYCFEYERHDLDELIQNEEKYEIHPDIRFGKVKYEVQNFSKTNPELFEHVKNVFLESIHQHSKDPRVKPTSSATSLSIFSDQIVDLILFQKHPAFKDEREWRIAIIPVLKPILFPPYPHPTSPPTIHKPKKHVEIGRGLKGGLRPKRIILGPNCIEKEEIRNSDIQLQRSKIPV